jgi:hypothetical protein
MPSYGLVGKLSTNTLIFAFYVQILGSSILLVTVSVSVAIEMNSVTALVVLLSAYFSCCEYDLVF